MGIYDRDYNRSDYGGGGSQYTRMSSGFGSIPPVVKWLLIINFAIFIVAFLIPAIGDFIYRYGAVHPITVANMIQVWRFITYQFLHGGVWHLVFNLMVLYFMGPLLERTWGSRAFLKFYLIAGATGGVVYTLLVILGILPVGGMVGASGAIYGVVAVIAVMYPRMKVLLYGIIPMTMVWLVVLVIIFSLINIASGTNIGGEAAHLTGLAVGFFYVKYKPLLAQMRMNRSKGAWEKKVQQDFDFQKEVDRILDKVSQQGVQSLTSREKQILQEATRREQQNAH